MNIGPLTWVEESRPYDDNNDWIARTSETIHQWGLADKRLGVENSSWFLTSRDYMRLTSVLPDATFVDCPGLVEQGRKIKSPQELEYMRHAGRVVDAAMMAAIYSTRAGAIENEVAAEVHKAQILAGSEHTGLPLFVNSGPRSNMMYATWYRRTIQRNEGMLFELVAAVHRYHAAMFRPVYVGDPPDSLIRGAEVTTDTVQKAKAIIRPGTKTGRCTP